MKFLIVGRSGSGKDELKRHLESQYGWKFVKSYTTRPKRTPDEDTHIFISHEEAAKIPEKEKVAVTFIKNNTNTPDEYFATMQQVQEADAYIIDPKGVKMLLENMPKETFEIIYMQAQSEEKRKEMACARYEDKNEALRIFEKRCESEKEQFDAFETSLKDGSFGTPNCTVARPIFNEYTEEDMESIAANVHTKKLVYKKLVPMVDDLMQEHLVNVSPNGEPIVFIRDHDEPDNTKQVEVTKEQFVQQMYHSQEGFATCISSWLDLTTTYLANTARVVAQEDITLRNYIHDLLQPKYTNSQELTQKVNEVAEKLVQTDEFWENLDNLVNSLL